MISSPPGTQLAKPTRSASPVTRVSTPRSVSQTEIHSKSMFTATRRPSGETAGFHSVDRIGSLIAPSVFPARSTQTSCCGSGRRKPYTRVSSADTLASAPPAAIRNGSSVGANAASENGRDQSALSEPVVRVKTMCPVGDQAGSEAPLPRPSRVRAPSRSMAISPSLAPFVTTVYRRLRPSGRKCASWRRRSPFGNPFTCSGDM